MAKRKSSFSTTTYVDVEQTRAPIAIWPANLRSQLGYLQKRYNIDPNAARAWYRWRYDQGAWMYILFLPEDDYAVIQLGPGSSVIVEGVDSPEVALKSLLAASAKLGAAGGRYTARPKSVTRLKKQPSD